jgi:DNA polymerase-4
MRKIIHIDMDAFYASVEQRDNPSYRGKPLVVGAPPHKRGVVAAASYEARYFGIHSAMPSRIASCKCPTLIFVSPRFDVYRTVSQQIRDIFHHFTPIVEPVALDEAYLDVTDNPMGIPSATLIAQEIKTLIFQETALTASAGVSINKFLAKMASGINKPNGLWVIEPAQATDFVNGLAIERFHGIGPATATKMHRLGIRTGADLEQWSEAALVQEFGKVGRFYYKIARAQDDRPVEPSRIRRSIGAETSFEVDLGDRASILQEMQSIAQTVKQRLDQHQTYGRTLTLKVKYADYQQVTRSKTVQHPLRELANLMALAQELLNATEVDHKRVRLLGITLSNFDEAETPKRYEQLQLTF